MNYANDQRIVMTLDAGGTNFVFSAIQGNEEIIKPIRLPSNGNNLNKCLENLIEGFKIVASQLPQKPVAISFAFPGPADYARGIIGDLVNLPGFRGGVAIGPMLNEIFHLPVFVNNDGDLFAYGEAIAGLLPEVNERLSSMGSSKRYANILGITLGTGFGGGIVTNGQLFLGDNGAAAEIWLMRNKRYSNSFAEESASIRAIKRVYAQYCRGTVSPTLTPKDIYDIAMGQKEGDQQAALYAFAKMGEIVGDALANAITLIDGIIVIGGGLAGAANLFLPSIMKELNSTLNTVDEKHMVDRLEVKAFNLEDENDYQLFIKGEEKLIDIPFTQKKVSYDRMKRIGVGLSRLGTSRAIAIGAYTFALSKIDNS